MLCSNCGKLVLPNSNICKFCGTKVDPKLDSEFRRNPTGKRVQIKKKDNCSGIKRK